MVQAFATGLLPQAPEGDVGITFNNEENKNEDLKKHELYETKHDF